MDENAPSAPKDQAPGGGTCPYYGASNSMPSDMDSWWCPNCNRDYPTRVFKCRYPDCWEFVFLDEYCELHNPDTQET